MKCPFCAVESAPQANFCSNCGSPLYLKVCPKCETVNEKTATECMKCGEPLTAQDESTAVPVSDAAAAGSPEPALVGESAAASPESVSEHASPVDTGNKEWKALLQEVEEEVHRQLGAEPQLARENSSDVAMRTVSSAGNSLPASSQTGDSTMGSEAKRSAAILLVLLVMVGGAIAAYYFRPLPGVTAAAKPPTNDEASPTASPHASPSAKPDAPRDEAKNAGEATTTPLGGALAESNPSAANPALPPVEANSAATTTAVAPASSEETTDAHPPTESKKRVPFSSPAARVDTTRQTSQSEPVTTKTRPDPRTTKRADNIAETLSAERRAVIETPAPRTTEPAVPEDRPCSEAMQALALCSAPAPQ